MTLYRILLPLWVAAVALIGLWRVLRRRETAADLRERLGLVAWRDWDQPHVWVHAASNGELNAVLPVIERLRDRHPDIPVLVTTNSTTGRALARQKGLAARLAPVDTRRATARLLAGARALVIVESEFWPNRILGARARDLPVVVLGGRLSKGSARNWARLPGLVGKVTDAVSLMVPQDPDSADRFARFGLGADRITAPVDFKSLYVAPSRRLSPVLDAALPEGMTWLAASTHPGEDEIVLDAHATARRDMPDLTLVLAPRHPDRAGDIARLLDRRGIAFARYSRGIEGRPEVILADTMGDMPLWYDRAAVAFVGGSLVDRGGHTPHEPLAHGAAILHGPHVSNFSWVYARIDTATPSARVTGAAALGAALRKLLNGEVRKDWLRRQRHAARDAADLSTLDHAIVMIAGRTRGDGIFDPDAL